jgi:hypothetical protein
MGCTYKASLFPSLSTWMNQVRPGTGGCDPTPGQVTIQVPTITSVTPSSGSSVGGTWVLFTGRGFDPDMTVYFGNIASPSRVVCGETSCGAMSPPNQSPGVVDVTVSVAGVRSATSSSDKFTYFYEGPSPGAIAIGASHVLWTNESVTATVTLNEVAPNGGTRVALSLSDGRPGDPKTNGPSFGVTVPASVTVPAGATSAQFPITIAAQASSMVNVIATTSAGSRSVGWWVYTGNIHVPGGTYNVNSDGTLNLTGYLRSPGAGGGSVSVATSNRNLLTGPSSVPIGADDTFTVALTAGSVDTASPATATFGYEGTTSTVNVNVEPPVVEKPCKTKQQCCVQGGGNWNGHTCF